MKPTLTHTLNDITTLSVRAMNVLFSLYNNETRLVDIAREGKNNLEKRLLKTQNCGRRTTNEILDLFEQGEYFEYSKLSAEDIENCIELDRQILRYLTPLSKSMLTELAIRRSITIYEVAAIMVNEKCEQTMSMLLSRILDK